MSLLPLVADVHGIPKPIHHTPWEMHPDMLHGPLHQPHHTPWKMHPDWLHEPLHQLRPWLNAGDHIPKKTHVGPDGFQVSLDVQHFIPSEITVKTVDDNIIIEAKHEDRPDEHGEVSRHFRRSYRLPDGFDVKDVVSAISSDGILTVRAPLETSASKRRNVRHVQIQQTGPARLNVNDKMDIVNGQK